MGTESWLIFGMRVAFQGFEHPCHIFSECTHGLETLLVLADILGSESVNGVPVLRRHYRHIADGEVLVELLECRRGTATAAGYNGGSEFSRHLSLLAEEQTLTERCDLPGGLAVIYR